MTFGQKLKKLRTENNLTQEDLAEKIFVTRTAISKWETDKGYPGIDSLKLLSDFFGTSIDDLISDADVENKILLEKKQAERCYFIAMAFLALTVLFTLLEYFLKQPYFGIGGICGVAGYIFFGLLSKPKYKRLQARKLIIPYVISRAVIFAVVVGVMVYTIITL